MNESQQVEILTQSEIEAAWSRDKGLPTASFDVRDVPLPLRRLTPYATFWGASDDSVRRDILRRTPEPLRWNLKGVVAIFDDALDIWLGGEEASNSEPSDAYVAFSAMRMAADSVQ